MRGGVSVDSRSEISSSSQGSVTGWTPAVLPGVAAFMDTSALRLGRLSGLIMASSVVLNCGGCTGLMGTSAQGCGCSGLMGTSTVLSRQGLRKASRSGSSGTSGPPMASQSALRGHSGLMGTSETCFWTRSELGGLSKSSMIVNGSLRGPTELSGFGLVYTFQPGAVVLGMEDSVGQIVWSLKESTAGGGGCTMVVEEVVMQSGAEASPSPTMVPCLWEGGTS